MTALESLTELADFRALVKRLYDTVNHLCDGHAYHPFVVFGARTVQEQLDLYAISRKKIAESPAPWGLWVIDKTSRRRPVTRALPDQSPHCYRAAVDIALVDDKLNVWLPDSHEAWGKVLREEAVKLGLVSGHDWKDFQDSAHVELPNWRQAAQHGKLEIVRRL